MNTKTSMLSGSLQGQQKVGTVLSIKNAFETLQREVPIYCHRIEFSLPNTVELCQICTEQKVLAQFVEGDTVELFFKTFSRGIYTCKYLKTIMQATGNKQPETQQHLKEKNFLYSTAELNDLYKSISVIAMGLAVEFYKNRYTEDDTLEPLRKMASDIRLWLINNLPDDLPYDENSTVVKSMQMAVQFYQYKTAPAQELIDGAATILAELSSYS